jgi:hypothetical protein
MNRRICAAGLLFLIGMSAGDTLLACGDKFLVYNRGTRFQRAAIAREPAAILIYTNPESELPKALATLPIDTILAKAGYQPTTVPTPADFEKALSGGRWDLIVVGMADAQAVSSRLRGEVVPVVLPVVFNSTAVELKETKNQYPVVLKAPAKSQSFLSAIDEALAHRPRQAKPTRKGD